VEGGAAAPAHPPTRKAPDELLPADIEEDHPVQRLAAAPQHGVEGLRLGGRPGKPIEHEARGGVGAGEPLLHQPDHHLVRHEPARIHVALGLEPERRTRRLRLAKHVAGGHLGDAPLSGDAAGLGAFARAGRAEEDHARAHARTRCRLRRKPS
jgi:hypothetical protein